MSCSVSGGGLAAQWRRESEFPRLVGEKVSSGSEQSTEGLGGPSRWRAVARGHVLLGFQGAAEGS